LAQKIPKSCYAHRTPMNKESTGSTSARVREVLSWAVTRQQSGVLPPGSGAISREASLGETVEVPVGHIANREELVGARLAESWSVHRTLMIRSETGPPGSGAISHEPSAGETVEVPVGRIVKREELVGEEPLESCSLQASKMSLTIPREACTPPEEAHCAQSEALPATTEPSMWLAEEAHYAQPEALGLQPPQSRGVLKYVPPDDASQCSSPQLKPNDDAGSAEEAWHEEE